MRKVLLIGTAVSALLAAQPSQAAPPKPKPVPMPVFSWTGCFVGGQGGWGWQRTKIIQQGQHTGFFTQITTFNSFSSGNIDTDGALFGGQVGCNYQVNPSWVVGFQGTFLGADIRGTGADPHNGAFDSPGGPRSVTFSGGTIGIDTKSLYSATGRIGYTGWSPMVMVYFRGGAAWMNTAYDLSHTALNYGAGTTLDVTPFGWTVGGGFEWMFATSWSFFAEYNYYFFDSKSLVFTFSPNNTLNSISVQPVLSTVTAGINYHFGPMP